MVSVEQFFSIKGKPEAWHWSGQMFKPSERLDKYIAELEAQGAKYRIVEDGGQAFKFNAN